MSLFSMTTLPVLSRFRSARPLATLLRRAVHMGAATHLRFATLSAVLLAVALPLAAQAQSPDRVPAEMLEITPPSGRVEGELSRMSIVPLGCRSAPSADVRRRIVDVAIQEWAFFGFPVLDRLNGARLLPDTRIRAGRVTFENTTRRAPTPNAREGERVAATIAGYWAVTPEGAGIVAAQARRWEERGAGVRWNAPWSAAFISWVMCEAGLGTRDEFHRAIAHWTYIDQAIRARDAGEGAPGGASDGSRSRVGYVAYDIGERAVEPGDLLCSGRRPRYANLAGRRLQMGEGASSHCDIVVEADAETGRILAIGGNVLRAVSLKVLAGRPGRGPEGGMYAVATSAAPLFAHLKLQAEPIDDRALSDSEVLAALTSGNGGPTPSRGALVLDALSVQGAWMEQGIGR
ncbi:MAG: DUF2272 domain-containing protein [Gemmatimonadetes bacterium]|nr:DUF2272 domain-containing protein [Gemmatimonadota bacterium]